MKNLITSMACIMILLVFVLQFAQNQIMHNRISAVDQTVNSFKEVVKQEGCISKENEIMLKKELADILDCGDDAIQVEGGRNPVFRGKLIRYRVLVPVENIISVPLFWGISEEDNRFDYEIERYTTSEFIGR